MLDAPRELPPLASAIAKGRLPSLESLGLEQEVDDPARGGEAEAHRALDRFLAGPVRDYADDHDALGRDGTSRLSPYLHFGCISRPADRGAAAARQGPEAFRRQLCWRDFYHHVLLHFPRNARSEFQDRYRGKIRWSYAQRPFEAWMRGPNRLSARRRGDAPAAREGWMHNRARLVVGSFLTKDLGIDWRWGERWFMRLLIDGDEANNNGNWQWIASVGTDPQPAFRRIYNPALHQERYDPEAPTCAATCPSSSGFPTSYMREPWTMPDDVQRECGCVIGEDYPAPIVDHKHGSRGGAERYRV